MVEINGRPFLDYVITNLRKAGYNELVIVVGYKKEQIIDYLRANNIAAKIIIQDQQQGTGHALLQAKKSCGQDNFLVLGGDNLWSVDDFKLMNKPDNFNYVSGIEVSNPERYGVLIIKQGKLIAVKEKPREFYGNLINAALYKFTPEIWPLLENLKPSARGEIELTDAVTELAEQGKVKVIKVKDYWLDLGSKDDLPKIEKFLKQHF